MTRSIVCVLAILVGGCGGSSGGGSGGKGGSSTQGNEAGSGGSTGGRDGTGGASTGGASGSGTGGGTGGASESVDSGTTGGDDAAAPADSGSTAGEAGGSSDNPCYHPEKIKNRTLPNLSVKDFCDAYEKYCMYTPDGSMMSKCGPGQPVGPLYRDRMDCETRYGAASASAKACRAGQMCVNAPAGLIVNACSHATGYCAGACK
ncbi:MAG TPA: hypothetical protein VN914_02060 [Polyangia bacterium]|nr:hypothetical protein [Polyangia bacterium]